MTNRHIIFDYFGVSFLIYLGMENIKSLYSKLFYMDIFPYIISNNKFSKQKNE